MRTRPLAGLIRRFWSASLTTRRRSTVGLKSTPKLAPLSAVYGLVVSVGSAARVAANVAAAVAWLTA